MSGSPIEALLNSISQPSETPTILELGEGAGNYAKLALARWPRARLFGIDHDGERYVEANRSLRAAFPNASWERVCASVDSPCLKFPADVDLVIGGKLTDGWQNGFARQAAAALKVGGTFLLEDAPTVLDALGSELKSLGWTELRQQDGCLIGRKPEIPFAAFTIDNLQVGQRVAFTTSFGNEELRAFAALSGDYNPLHFNDDYARSLGFDERLVFGLLTSAVLSRLVGVHLPGLNSLIREVKVEFPNPLYRGQPVRIEGTVDRADVERRLLILSVYGYRVSDEAKVLRGKVQVSVPSPLVDWRSGWREKELASS